MKALILGIFNSAVIIGACYLLIRNFDFLKTDPGVMMVVVAIALFNTFSATYAFSCFRKGIE